MNHSPCEIRKKIIREINSARFLFHDDVVVHQKEGKANISAALARDTTYTTVREAKVSVFQGLSDKTHEICKDDISLLVSGAHTKRFF